MGFALMGLVAIVLLFPHLYNDSLNSAAVMTPASDGRIRLVIEPSRGSDANQPEQRPGRGGAASPLPGHSDLHPSN
jgi:hypothetical protein